MPMLRTKHAIASIAAIAACLPAASSAQAQTYNTSTDWSSSTSTPGPWTYGEEYTLGGPLTNYTIETDYQGGQVSLWNNPDAQSLCPAVFKNNTNQTITAFSTVTIGANETIFHPGNQGQYSVFQFAAQNAGSYKLTSSFGA